MDGCKRFFIGLLCVLLLPFGLRAEGKGDAYVYAPTLCDTILHSLFQFSSFYSKVIDEYDGILPFTEKASPEAVKRVFGMSKAAFKSAIGRLLKEDRIIVREKSIVRKQEDQ